MGLLPSGVKTYDPKKVIILLAGVPVTGFADGTFVKVTPAGDFFMKQVGADGEVGRAKNNDRTYTVEITLMQTSESHSVLAALAEADSLTGEGVVPLSITDLRGGALYVWKEAWVKTDPGIERGKELADTTWVLDTGQPTSNYNATVVNNATS